MGSFIEHIECPDCGSEAYQEFWYKTGEESVFCMSCGYSRQFEIIESEEDSEETQGLPNFKITEHHGHGAYRIRYSGSLGYQCGAFVGPESEEEFLRLVENEKDKLIHAEYTTFVDGELTKTIVINEESLTQK